MEKHVCRICYSCFTDGRALGGHMRCHAGCRTSPPPVGSAAAVAASKAHKEVHFSVTEMASKGKEKAAAPPSENPGKSLLLVDLSAGDRSLSVGQDDHFESSPRQGWTFPREVSLEELDFAGNDVDLLTFLSDIIPSVGAAYAIMKISRDKWPQFEEIKELQYNDEDEDEDDDDEDYTDEKEEEEEGDDDDDEEEDKPVAATKPRGRRTRFQCPRCKRVFRSFQALGGHRATLKRQGLVCCPPAAIQINGDGYERCAAGRRFECPYCYRVFSSGQALGGHKRAHFSSTATTANALLHLPPSKSYISAANAGENSSRVNLTLPNDKLQQEKVSAVSAPPGFPSK